MKFSTFLLVLSCCLSFGLLAQLPTPLSGNYTLDPALPQSNNNYTTFASLANDLNDYGVIGAVTVDVKEGNYSERFELIDVIGASAINRITIQADPSNTNPVILSSPSSSTSTGAIKLSSTKYITFKGLTLTGNQSNTYLRVVYMTGTLVDINFQECHFIGLQSTSTYAKELLYGTGVVIQGNGLTVSNCDFDYGADAIYMSGNASNKSTQILVENSDFMNGYGDWMYIRYFNNILVYDNKYYPRQMSTTQYLIYGYNTSTTPGQKFDIRRNDIRLNNTSTTYGFRMEYWNSLPADPSVIANNFIQSLTTSSSSSRFLFYIRAAANMDIVHNSVKLQDGSNTSSRIIHLLSGTTSTYTPGNYNIQNNIFWNTVAGNNGNLFYVSGTTAAGYINNISNNIYYAPNSTEPWYFGTTAHTGYSTWAAASGDVNSQVGNPQFMGPTDLHTEGILASANGTPLANVTDDFDGDARPLPAGTDPDIGADEFIPPTCPAVIDIKYTGGDTNTMRVEWTSVGSSQWEIEYGPSGFTPGTGTKIITNNNPDTITGLASQQTYDIYVRSICTPGDTSRQSGPGVGNTYGQGVYMDYDQNCIDFIDITNIGTDHVLYDNDEVGITLPFPWIVQGEMITEINLSNNGGLHFNTTSGQIYYDMSAPGFYPLITDLDNDIAGVNQVGVLTAVIGVAPNRKYVIEWKNRTRKSGYTNPDPVTFELVYDEATSDVYYLYEDVDFGKPQYNNGADAEIGVRASKQNIDISINSPSYLNKHNCVHFYYTDCPKPQGFILLAIDTSEAIFTWNAGLSGETSWEVVYGPAGFDPNTSGTSITVSNNFMSLPNLQENTTYDVYVKALCTSGDISDGLFGSFTTLSRCGRPFDVKAWSGTDSIMSDWEWEDLYQAEYPVTNFNLYYGAYDFDPSVSGNIVTTGTNQFDTTVDNTLLPGGVYDIYLQAECGSTVSDTVGPFTVVMPLSNDIPCNAFDIPVDGNKRVFSNEDATFDQDEYYAEPDLTGHRRRDGWAETALTNTVWFTFTAPASGNLRIDATDVEFDGQIAVYDVGVCNVYKNSFVVRNANDDEISQNPGDTSVSPNFTVCGLTPGDQYYMVYDSHFADSTGYYSLRLSEIDLNAGNFIGDTIDLCTQEVYNMYNGLTGYSPGGYWIDVDNTNRIVNDSMFNTNGLPSGDYTFEYRVTEGCAFDSMLIEFEVYGKNFAGVDGTHTICMKEPTSLLARLGDLVDHGGQWYDYNGNPMDEGYIRTGDLPDAGDYTYMYIVDNGICAADTSYVTITVDGACDFTGLDELNTQNVKVYPNPTTGIVNVDWSNETKMEMIEVYNAQGQLVQTHDVEGNERLKMSLDDLAPGVYLLKMKAESGIGQLRLVKQ